MPWGSNLAWAIEHVDAPWLEQHRAARRAVRPVMVVATAGEAGKARLCSRSGCGLPITRQSPRRPFLYCSRGCKRATDLARSKAAAAVTPEPPRKAAPRQAACHGPECSRSVVAQGKNRPRAYCTKVCYHAGMAARRAAARERKAA